MRGETVGPEQRPQILRFCSSADIGKDFGLVYHRVCIGRSQSVKFQAEVLVSWMEKLFCERFCM